MKVRSAHLHYFEVEELLCKILGLDENEEHDYDEITDEHFRCDFEAFHKIVEVLLAFTPAVKSELTEEIFHAFVLNKGKYCEAMVKSNVEKIREVSL